MPAKRKERTEKKAYTITAKVTENDFRLIKELSKETKQTTSQVLRNLIREAKKA